MTRTFVPLDTLAALEAALEASAHGPVVLFKHSPTCGISAQAEEELREWLASGAALVPVYQLRVREHRAVSDDIAARFRVRHESPQVLVIEARALRWSASHFRVTASELQSALDKLASTPRS